VKHAAIAQQKPIRFRGRSFIAFVLSPEAPVEGWLGGLDKWIHNSPGFFLGRAVVLDLSLVTLTLEDITSVVSALASRGIRVLGIESPGAVKLGHDLPPEIKDARAVAIDEPVSPGTPAGKAVPAVAVAASPVPESRSLILDAPVRSGQSIIYPEGDVIVLGSIGSGAEVVAGGSIHVYGTLRGRALAGAMGNAGARIFCRRNEAELMAIDGCYRTADTMEPSTRGKPAQCLLDNGVLFIATLE
jgi:septum site-determining protein MinC